MEQGPERRSLIRLPGTTGKDGAPRRRSPVRFFHVVYFVMGGGLAVLWSPLGLLAVAVAVGVGYLVLKAMASSLDMNQARSELGQLRDDMVRLQNAVEHPDGSAQQQLETLEILHRRGGIGDDDYDASRARIVGAPPRDGQADENATAE